MVTYPEDWREEKIEDIFSVITDYVAAGSFADLSQNVVYLKSPDYAQLVRTKDIKSKFTNNDFVYISKSAYEYLWRVHFDKPIIIMPNIGNCGEVYYLEPHMLPYKNSALGPNAIMLKKTTHDMKFLSYALERDDFQSSLADITSPSGQTKFNKTALAKISIVIPECFSEQQAIASVLSDFDEHIDNLSELIEKKKAIRDGALEDLVSGRTRLDGFDGEWEEGTIGDILTIHHGKNQHSVESFDGKYPILGTGGIIGKATEYLCDWECVLIGRKGTIDNPMYMNTPFWTIDTLYYSKPKINQCVKFQYYLFCTINWLDYAESSGSPSLAKNVIEGVPISIPNIPEQQAIAQVLSAMDEEIDFLKIEKDKMIQIKEGAMDDLLTGRVRLKV